MRLRRSRGIGMAVLCCLFPMMFAGAAPPLDEAAQESVAGRLLVAERELNDPNFKQTVIYMIRHDGDGAVGLVVNRQLGEVQISRLFKEFGADPEGLSGRMTVYGGGPVQPGLGFVLHSSDVMVAASEGIDERVAVTRDLEILRAIADGRGPRRSLFVMGYAGWAPGQLEGEIAAGAWAVTDYDEALVFDEGGGGKWERAIAGLTIDL